MNEMIPAVQTVFARWSDGYYYPAVADEISEHGVKVSFLDGGSCFVSNEQIVELCEAFRTMQIQGNWQNQGLFYNGRLDNSQDPMVMYYNDGDVEAVELSQLRGARPGEPVIWKQAAFAAIAVGVAGLAILGIRKARRRKRQD